MLKNISTREKKIPRQQLVGLTKLITMSSLSLLIFFSPQVASACGAFISEEVIDGVVITNTTPIEDCADPFKVNVIPTTATFTYTFNGEEVNDSSTLEVTGLPVELSYIPEGGTINHDSYKSLYKHEGEDYRVITEGNEGVPDINATGTYSLLTEVFVPNGLGMIPKFPPWQRLWNKLIPTAHAQIIIFPFNIERFVVTFTVELLPPPPAGASSVLFLPGIQASRLYKDGLLGTEDQVWEPNRNQDVEQLEMTEEGFSVNDIYTRDVVDEILVPSLGDNIYKSFLSTLEDMKEDGEIADSLAFAYDWRYSVQDIAVSGTRYQNGIKHAITEIENMASSSYTGKVTIIGHSNGGLLAKAIISELQRIGKEDLVDKVVFVGVPQLGTPKAIGVLLHGLDQQKLGGLVIDDMTTRDIVKNMPGVYGLLPSQKYFTESGEVLITSDNSSTTTNIRAYGDIDSLAELSDFVLDVQELRNDDVPIYEPSTLNTEIMQSMIASREVFDNWVAPNNIEVYEVIGTGLATIKGFEYRRFPCGSTICLLEGNNYMKAYPIFTNEGDETVVTLSASAYLGQKTKAIIDLYKESDGLLNPDREHADITESSAVQDFITSVIKYPYINDTVETPTYSNISAEYTIVGAHSPVNILLADNAGKKVGIINSVLYEEVSGSQYFELGGSTYLIVPKDTEYTVTVKGTANGVYSLTIDSLSIDNVQTNKFTYLGASTTPNLVATFKASSSVFSTIKTDINGDGVIDREQNLDGSEIIPPVTTYSYNDLRSLIRSFNLNQSRERLLLLQVQIAEQLSKKTTNRIINRKLELLTLISLENTLTVYNEKKYITKEQLEQATKIIDKL